MTREQYNQANDYISQIEICEKVIECLGPLNGCNSAQFKTFKGQSPYGVAYIEDAALVEGLTEYIKTWYTNRKAELETLLSEI